VVMPHMNGRELWRRVKETRPSIKCLFMSGCTADVMSQHGIIDTSGHFMEKPFSSRDLAEKARGVWIVEGTLLVAGYSLLVAGRSAAEIPQAGLLAGGSWVHRIFWVSLMLIGYYLFELGSC